MLTNATSLIILEHGSNALGQSLWPSMESVPLFAENLGVQPKFPSVQVCNTAKCAPQVCSIVEVICT